jgi:hypothetical protein
LAQSYFGGQDIPRGRMCVVKINFHSYFCNRETEMGEQFQIFTCFIDAKRKKTFKIHRQLAVLVVESTRQW